MVMWLAYEDDMIIGVFSDTAMSTQWVSEYDNREVYELLLLDKTFSQMAVEYNNKYGG